MWLVLAASSTPAADPSSWFSPYVGPFGALILALAVIGFLIRQQSQERAAHREELAAKDLKVDAANEQVVESMRECIALATRMTQELSDLPPALARILEAIHEQPRRRS